MKPINSYIITMPMSQPYGLSVFIILCLMLFLSACQPKTYQRTDYVFGTLVEITIYDAEHAASATQAVLDDLRYLESLLHAFKNSQLSVLNDKIADGQTQIIISPELAEILMQAKKDSQPVENWFNPAIGNLVALWGFHQDNYPIAIPAKDNIDALLTANPSMNDLSIENNIAHIRNPALAIDLGGYAKGLALDRAAAILQKQAIHHALINIGGNILALGQKGELHWTVGIRDPNANRAYATVTLYDGDAIGTSGDYQRFFTVDNQRYHHILDPATGYPANVASSVTIIVNQPPHSGRYSDMLTKPFFIAGMHAFPVVCQRAPVSIIAFTDHQNNLFLSQGMKDRMTVLDNQKIIHLFPDCPVESSIQGFGNIK